MRHYSVDPRLWISGLSFLAPFGYLSLCAEDLTEFHSTTISHVLFLLLFCSILCVTRDFKLLIKYAIQAFLLGLVCGISTSIITRLYSQLRPQTIAFFVYVEVMALFHFFEFFVTAVTNISSLSYDSFLLNHSIEYWAAAGCACTEHFLETFIFPGFYAPSISVLGLLMCITGEAMRKLAMCHASVGFTHQIAMRRNRNHILVTTGVYGLMRHPGYFGWLLWSVGTQIILCNPLCTIFYAYVSYNFFRHRIAEEEKYLIEFFGQKYISYMHRVPSGIPGI